VLLNVIIPSYRAKATIADTIRSVWTNRGFSGEFNITVVDSSDDDTVEVVKSLGIPVNIIRLPEKAFPGQSRNRGVEATSGDVSCFIDADAVADENWLGEIARFLEIHANVAAVGGPILNGNPKEGWSRLAHWCEFSGFGPHAPTGPRNVQPTVNLAIRRSAFEKYGPFLEEQFGSEDVLLIQRLRDANEELHFTPEIRVYHRNKTTLEAINRHQWILGNCTGRAAVLYKLTGSLLARRGGAYPVPFIKTWFILWRVISQEPNELLSFLFYLPRVFMAMVSYARGFRHGVKSALKERK
jgi:glycosyltransferase involved in cell wall biosynthesis